jgi:signal transduction histidine kinase
VGVIPPPRRRGSTSVASTTFAGGDSSRRRTALLGALDEPRRLSLDALATQTEAVREAWERRLARLQFTAEERAAVSALALSRYLASVRDHGFEAYAQAVERAGHDLAERGMPEERAMAALAAQLESALPHVVGTPEQDQSAVVRIALSASVALAAGYSAARAASWRRFGERERERLSRDLHDEIGHHLVVLKLYLGLVQSDLSRAPAARIRAKLDEATELVGQAIQSVRRLILDLGPVALEGVGFLPAVKLYARQFGARTGVKVHVRNRGLTAPLPAAHETALYRLLQGALSNVLKHAQARQVTVTMGVGDGSITMAIEDDGVGFDTSAPRQAFGLAAMRDRVASLDGRFHVESQPGAPGPGWHGTRIEVELPLAGPART